ncbi:hypothetical protein SHI21_06675 [Bacteriovorax sp. PP10]|uniref:Uncharacterized protein n=1 Tax=Bacteriovorax antarcticus TaxID=3088717 RepID=A0ABU5VW66_9BACT|nr:hypothetical protein [Bacteriovorax sp. PP10]MEA9355875.1 hypothetical protein [Bacteriovorax sp. PP10]
MKKFLVLAAILSTVFSFQAKAAAIAGSYLATTLAYGSLYMSEHNKVAQVYADGQEFLMNGDMSLSLEELVRNTKATHPELSEYEIVDGLMNEAGAILGN